MMEDIRKLRATPQLWNLNFYVLKKRIFGYAKVKGTFCLIILQTLHNILQINFFECSTTSSNNWKTSDYLQIEMFQKENLSQTKYNTVFVVTFWEHY